MNFDYCNNAVSRLMAKHYPHDFSICDIDSVVRYEYSDRYGEHRRLILLETKHEKEGFTLPQLKTQTVLSASIDWTRFDSSSGVYGIRHNEAELSTSSSFKIYRIVDREAILLGTIQSADLLHEWFTGKPLNICLTAKPG